MKFTNKFTFITSVIVLTCIALLLVGGIVSLRALSLKYHQQRIDSVIQVIEKQIDKQTTTRQFDQWLPDVLEASGVVRLEVRRDDVMVYHNYYESHDDYPMNLLLHYSYQLEKYPKISLMLHTRQPFSELQFTFWPLLGVGTAILLCLSLLYFSLRWIKRSFHGAELLEKRAYYLLQNNPTARIAQKGEWPKTASQALDVLSERLENSRKERSVFDIHIRSKAFLDEDTGLANNLAFENRLDALTMDESYSSNTLILINLNQLSTLKYQFGIEESEKVIQQVVDLLSHFCRRYDDSFHGRIKKSEFVVLLPQMTYQETKTVAKKLTNLLSKLQLPEPSLAEGFFYLGVVNFPCGTISEDIMDDVNRALLVAEHQSNSGWHLSEERLEEVVISKGTVRWRTLLTNILDKKAIILYRQHVMKRNQSDILYAELWPRIIGYDQEVIAAGTFMPMAAKCGLNEQFDKQMLDKVLSLLVLRGEHCKPISINIGASLLMNKENNKWLIFELMQKTKKLRNNLVIEISEHIIERDYASLRSVLITLQKIGCKIAVDNVGKTVVNTQYILDFNIDYLKLHASLIRDIHIRKTNQIAVQSLMSSCLNSDAKVIAVGVDNKQEWKCLLQLGVYGGQGAYFSVAKQMESYENCKA